jgi:hypothetical protein
MKNLKLSFFFMLGFGLFLVGCHGHDYAPIYQSNVQSIKPIVLPEDLTGAEVKDYYPMPKLTKPLPTNTTVSLVPPGSSLEKK